MLERKVQLTDKVPPENLDQLKAYTRRRLVCNREHKYPDADQRLGFFDNVEEDPLSRTLAKSFATVQLDFPFSYYKFIF